jgi:CheY-like chemotaxis protein
MNEGFISLKMMIVSDSASERELIRREAQFAAVPIQVVEVAAADDGAVARAALEREAADIVFCDSRMSKAGRRRLFDAARALKAGPLAILIGAASLKTREVLTDGLVVDGALAKPIDVAELRRLIDNCVRARLPSQVLIVDDSSTVRVVVRRLLQASRFRLNLDEAEDGAQAIERAARQRYRIVFLDCHMPGLDGFATLHELKRKNPDCKVVMITGTRDMRIEDRAQAEGASDFLYKPFFASDVDVVLSRLYGLIGPRWN